VVVWVAVGLCGASAALAAPPVVRPVPGSPFKGGDTSYGSMAFSPSGRLLAVVNDRGGSVSAFSVSSAGALTRVPGSPFPIAGSEELAPRWMAFSPSGRLLAVANALGGMVHVFSVSSAGVLKPVGNPVDVGMFTYSMAFSPSGSLLAVGDDEGVSVFSVSSSGALAQIPGSPFETSGNLVAFSPSGKLLAVAADSVSLLSVSANGTLKPVGSPVATSFGANAVAFSPSGGLVAAVAGTLGNHGAVSVFSVTSAGALAQVAGSPFATGQDPFSVAFSPSGGLLATANTDDYTVSVFSVNAAGALTQVSGSPFETGGDSVAFNPSGSLMAVAGYYGSVAVFSISSTNAPAASAQITASHVKADADGTITFQGKVPGPGTVDLLESAWSGSHRLASGRGHANATHSGVIHLRVSLNSDGKRVVQEHRSAVVLRLSVTYTPTHGSKRTIGFYGLHLGSGCPATAKNGARTETNCATKTPTTTTPTTTKPTTTTPVGNVASTIDVSMHEFSFTLTENGAPIASVPSGQVTFVVTDDGTIQHNFDLLNVHVGGLMDPGQSQSFTVSLAPGTYKYQCDIPGHADAGMKGTLTVTPAGR
jgi:WD40 repeat protein